MQAEADDVLETPAPLPSGGSRPSRQEVHTIEIIPAVAESAAVTLRELACDNVKTYVGDGSGFRKPRRMMASWSRLRPANVPPPLIEQLKPGAQMIIPMGSRLALQYLMIVEKDAEGRVTTRKTLPVSFVPLTRAD